MGSILSRRIAKSGSMSDRFSRAINRRSYRSCSRPSLSSSLTSRPLRRSDSKSPTICFIEASHPAFSFRARKLSKHLVAQLRDREEIGNQLRVEIVRRFHLSEGVAYDGLKHQQLALLG